MGTDSIKDRARALENAFFASRDQEKLEALRAKIAKEAKTAELAAATGIEDAEVLEQLHALEIGPDTYSALALVPLVEIAWADGTLDAAERKAILQALVAEGFEDRGPAHQMLVSWLAARPGPELRAAWFEYVGALCARLSPEACAELKSSLLGRAQAVAAASGGFLGFGSRISPPEQQVIDDLVAAFPG